MVLLKKEQIDKFQQNYHPLIGTVSGQQNNVSYKNISFWLKKKTCTSSKLKSFASSNYVFSNKDSPVHYLVSKEAKFCAFNYHHHFPKEYGT